MKRALIRTIVIRLPKWGGQSWLPPAISRRRPPPERQRQTGMSAPRGQPLWFETLFEGTTPVVPDRPEFVGFSPRGGGFAAPGSLAPKKTRGLKPSSFSLLVARLKACPDTNHPTSDSRLIAPVPFRHALRRPADAKSTASRNRSSRRQRLSGSGPGRRRSASSCPAFRSRPANAAGPCRSDLRSQ